MKLTLQFHKSGGIYLVLTALYNWLEVAALKPKILNAEIF